MGTSELSSVLSVRRRANPKQDENFLKNSIENSLQRFRVPGARSPGLSLSAGRRI